MIILYIVYSGPAMPKSYTYMTLIKVKYYIHKEGANSPND